MEPESQTPTPTSTSKDLEHASRFEMFLEGAKKHPVIVAAVLMAGSISLLRNSFEGLDYLAARISPLMQAPAGLCVRPDVPALLSEEDYDVLDRIEDVDLDGDGTMEYVATARRTARGPSDELEASVLFLKCDKRSGRWRVRLKSGGALVDCGLWTETMQLEGNDSHQILVAQGCGSGSYFTYQLVRDGGSGPTVAHSGTELFQGNAWEDDGTFVLRSSDRIHGYRWNGSSYIEIEYSDGAQPRSTLINYWWNEDLTPGTDAALNPAITFSSRGNTWSIILGLDQTLYLRRHPTLDHAIGIRMLFGDDTSELLNIRPSGDRTYEIHASKPGKSSIMLVPDGYNNERRIEVVITAADTWPSPTP